MSNGEKTGEFSKGANSRVLGKYNDFAACIALRRLL